MAFLPWYLHPYGAADVVATVTSSGTVDAERNAFVMRRSSICCWLAVRSTARPRASVGESVIVDITAVGAGVSSALAPAWSPRRAATTSNRLWAISITTHTVYAVSAI